MLTTEFTSPNHKTYLGLTEEEVLARRQEFGKNVQRKRRPNGGLFSSTSLRAR